MGTPYDNEQMLELERLYGNGKGPLKDMEGMTPEILESTRQKLIHWRATREAGTRGAMDLGFTGEPGKARGNRVPPIPPAAPGPVGAAPPPAKPTGPVVTEGVPYDKGVVTSTQGSEPPLSDTDKWLNEGMEPTAGDVAAAYKTPTHLVRASAYVPGLGGMPAEDGAKWKNAMKSFPAGVRDPILGPGASPFTTPQAGKPLAGLTGDPTTYAQYPSRGPVWREPTDQEAEAAVIEEREAKGLRPKTDRAHLEEWKDRKWAEAYDDAQRRGVSLYRGRDISSASPGFMKQAKADAEGAGGFVESAVRMMDKARFLGAGFDAIDVGAGNLAKNAARGAFELFDVPPPSFLAPDPEEQAMGQRNLQRGSREIEAHPGGAVVGATYGMLAPGVGDALATGATKGIAALAGKEAGIGMLGGMGTAAGAAALAGAGEQFGSSMVHNQALETAGLPQVPLDQQLEDAWKTGAVAAVPGAVLGAAKGMSRGMREIDSPKKSAHTTLGPDSTDFWTMKGLRTPEGHQELSDENPVLGSYAAARADAVEKGADHLLGKAGEANVTMERGAAELAARVESEGEGFRNELDALSTDIVDMSATRARQTEEEAMLFTQDLMNSVEHRRQDMGAKHRAQSAVAHAVEGAPPPAPTPGPDMYFSDIARARKEAAGTAPYGLRPDYPTVNARPIIDKGYDILTTLALDDGAHLPTPTHKKIKDAVDSLFIHRTVGAEDAKDFEHIIYESTPLKDGRVKIIAARNLHARELDHLIQAFDEAGKWPDSASPDAAKYRELAAVARKLRDEGFNVLGHTKAQQSQDLLENERMMRAIGLPQNVGEVDPQDVDQVRAVHANIKALAEAPSNTDLITPDGLAVPRKEFERWLGRYDEGLLDRYMTLRRLSRQAKQAADFDITINNTPMGRAKSIKAVTDALLGNNHQVAAVLESFKSVGDRVKSLQTRQKRVGSLYKALGVKSEVTDAWTDLERDQYRVGINKLFLQGGPEFDALRRDIGPEFKEGVDKARQAAVDIDSMFRSLGFGPRHWREDFDELTRQQDNVARIDVMDRLDTIFHAYEKYGGKGHYDKVVNKVFDDSPETVAALKRMTKERAFQWLRNDFGSDAKEQYGASRVWHAAASDFVQNHVDALVSRPGSRGEKVNPLNVPAPYAAGLVVPGEDDPNREAEVRTMSGAKAMEALFRAVGILEAREKETP